MFLDKGLARSLGINEQGFREALGRIHHHPRLSEYCAVSRGGESRFSAVHEDGAARVEGNSQPGICQ